MSCFWRHSWSNWNGGYQQRIVAPDARYPTGVYIEMQKRVCSKCNKIEERRS